MHLLSLALGLCDVSCMRPWACRYTYVFLFDLAKLEVLIKLLCNLQYLTRSFLDGSEGSPRALKCATVTHFNLIP